METLEERGIQNAFLPIRSWLMWRDLLMRNALTSAAAFTAAVHEAQTVFLSGQYDPQKIVRRSLGLEPISKIEIEKGPLDYDSL